MDGAAVRTQSAGHPLKTVAPHRYQTPKGQVSAPQITNPAHYWETKKA
ncbi:hypothetical protein ACFU67_12680 [Streptomyces rhizosphaericola]